MANFILLGLVMVMVYNSQSYKAFQKHYLKEFWEIFYENYNLRL